MLIAIEFIFSPLFCASNLAHYFIGMSDVKEKWYEHRMDECKMMTLSSIVHELAVKKSDGNIPSSIGLSQ